VRAGSGPMEDKNSDSTAYGAVNAWMGGLAVAVTVG
jgi:hypothetical protein